MFRRILAAALMTALLAATGCDTGDPDGENNDSVASPCEFTEAAVLDLTIGASFDSSWSAIRAEVYEYAEPNLYEVIHEVGNCRHVVLAHSSCDPPCDWDKICTADGNCEAFPETVSAGTLTITGLGDPVVLEGESWSEGLYYQVEFETPDEPPYDAGDPIGASFSGAVFPAVDLSATGVAPFAPDINDELDIPNTEALVISWADPDPESCVELRLHGMAAHDGAPLQDLLWCIADDTGSITVPAEILQGFPTSEDIICDQYQWCPPSEISRYRQSAADTEGGPARMTVRWAVEFRYELHD